MNEIFVIFFFITLSVMIITLGVRGIVNRQLTHKERMAASQSAPDKTDSGDYRRLEERVRVLERIATENREDLAAQIEQLRDLDLLADRSPERERAQ